MRLGENNFRLGYFKPINMRQLCANDEEAPFNVPLHPDARRFYRERGYLNNLR